MNDDKSRGIYNKFNVSRTDGKSAPGQKHDGCDYFVLDLVHDPFAMDAIKAYADRCITEYPKLAGDLYQRYFNTVLGPGPVKHVNHRATSKPTPKGKR